MKRLFRRILIMILLLVVATLGGSLYLHHASKSEPEWFRTSRPDPQELTRLGIQADRKIESLASAVAHIASGELRNDQTPRDPVVIRLHEDELDALVTRWLRLNGWLDALSPHVADPAVRVRGGELILVGRVRQIDRVISFHFKPSLVDSGKLTLTLDRVTAGTVRVPMTLLEPLSDRAISRWRRELARTLPAARASAEMDDRGLVNGSFAAACWLMTLDDLIARRPIEPVLFMPAYVSGDRVPVRVLDLRSEGRELELTVLPMDLAERAVLRDRVIRP